ncbi:hypothetical protein GCM10023405_27500 [Streptomonospora salina]
MTPAAAEISARTAIRAHPPSGAAERPDPPGRPAPSPPNDHLRRDLREQARTRSRSAPPCRPSGGPPDAARSVRRSGAGRRRALGPTAGAAGAVRRCAPQDRDHPPDSGL